MEAGACLACLSVVWDTNYSNQNVATEVNFISLLLIEKENENVANACV